MKTQNHFLTILISVGIFLLYYVLTFWQLTHPFTLNISILAFCSYGILYFLVQKATPKTIRTFATIGAFTLTFTAFWANIVHIILFAADLRTGNNPALIIGNCLLYGIFFVLFYRLLATKQTLRSSEEKTLKNLQLILDIAFPITTAVCVFIGTLLAYALLMQITISTLLQENNGSTILIAIVTLTTVVTVLTTFLFEKWLYNAEKHALEKIMVVLTGIGAGITILLAHSYS